jgi:hypothetical protein
MPKQKTDDLIKLIRSLTRAEKRHFRLFVRRNQSSDDILFLQLFDYLDKHKEYDEEHLRKRIKGIKKSQLSNLKAHLYKQLLISLRLLNKNHHEDIHLRENLDYAKVLYAKGLYRQALEVLDKTKQSALALQLHTQALEIAEFEKMIEGQHITRSIEGRAEELSAECTRLSQQTRQNNAFSNLALRMYGLYLRVGLARDEKDFYMVKEFFHGNLPKVAFDELDFWGKIYYCQAFFWYHHMRQDFPQCYRYAQRWVDLFRENRPLVSVLPQLYLKGVHNLLSTLFNMWRYDRFMVNLRLLQEFPGQYDLSYDYNAAGLYELYRYNHLIMKHFMEGTFTEGLALVDPLMEIIENNTYNWDDHRIMLFYYRIACLYFGAGDTDRAIDFLNLIINQRAPDYRNDIQAFSRILNLIAHYELGNTQLVEYQVKSVYRFLSKKRDLQETHRVIFHFLRRIPRMREEEMTKEFQRLKEKLVVIARDPNQRRPFLYLDIISWLEAKIEGVAVQDIIRRKFEARQTVES